MNRRGVVLALSGALAARGAWAQGPSEIVQVEVLLFAWVGGPLPAALDPANVDPPRPGRSLAPSGTAATYAQLPAAQLRLAGTWQRLRLAAQTRPLLHLGWRQGLWDQIPVALELAAAEASDPPFITGSALLRGGRQNVMRLDLDYRPVEQIDQRRLERRYRLRSERSLGFGQNVYFDHPLLGALVRLDALEPNG